MDRNPLALAWAEIHNRPTATRAANRRLFMGDSSNDQDTGRRKRKRRTNVVAPAAGPALLVAFAAGRNSDPKATAQHYCVLNLGVLSSPPFALLNSAARSGAISPDCPADCASTSAFTRNYEHIVGKIGSPHHARGLEACEATSLGVIFKRGPACIRRTRMEEPALYFSD